MNIMLTIRLALKNIIGNKLRSSLTILGLVIGIASVILLVGIVRGATNSITDSMSGMGADMITVYLYEDDKSLSTEDVVKIKQLKDVAGVTPYNEFDGKVTKGGKPASNVVLVGGGGDFAKNMNYSIVMGRDLSQVDVDNYTKCVIIGNKIKEAFWKSSNPIGDTIKIKGDNYTVVGVMGSQGSSYGSSVDNMMVMPLTAGTYLGQSDTASQLFVRAKSEEIVNQVSKRVKAYIKKAKNVSGENLDVQSQKQMLESTKEITRTMSLLLGGIASISLLVGGIGVMNVMLVSVTERTREVGIRKSLGAKKRDILFQFLVESVVLSVFGGLVGVLFGILFGRIAILIGGYFSPSIGMILLSVAVSVGVGVIFGILPAYRAAKIKPVDALRYE